VAYFKVLCRRSLERLRKTGNPMENRTGYLSHVYPQCGERDDQLRVMSKQTRGKCEASTISEHAEATASCCRRSEAHSSWTDAKETNLKAMCNQSINGFCSTSEPRVFNEVGYCQRKR